MAKHGWLIGSLVLIFVAGCTAGRSGTGGKGPLDIIRIDKDALRVSREFTPVAEAVSQELGRRVEIRAEWDISKLDARLAQRADYAGLLYLDAAEFCRINEKYPLTPIAARVNARGMAAERGLIVVRAGSPIKTIEDLKGKRFVFGPYGSPHLFYNVLELFKAEQMPTAMLKSAFYTNGSAGAARRVAMKWADAGVVTQTWWQTTTERGVDVRKLLKDELRVIAETEPMPEQVWATTASVNAEDRQRLAKVLMEKGSADPRIAKTMGAQWFVAISASEMQATCRRIQRIKNLPGEPSLLTIPGN